MADRDEIGREAPIVITPRGIVRLVEQIVATLRRKIHAR